MFSRTAHTYSVLSLKSLTWGSTSLHTRGLIVVVVLSPLVVISVRPSDELPHLFILLGTESSFVGCSADCSPRGLSITGSYIWSGFVQCSWYVGSNHLQTIYLLLSKVVMMLQDTCSNSSQRDYRLSGQCAPWCACCVFFPVSEVNIPCCIFWLLHLGPLVCTSRFS